MKKEKKIILLNWYIILQPIIDILTSLGVRYGSDSITLGVAIRAVFVGIMAFYVMFIYRGKYEKAVKILCGYNFSDMVLLFWQSSGL